MRTTRWTRCAPGVLLLLLGLPGPGGAQIPETFENLQALPADIERRDLIDIMRSFTFATGYRCSGCHVGEEGQSFAEYDFASDEPVLKRKAREMIRMVRAINAQHLAELPDRGEPPVQVTCATCHGGVARPEALDDILVRVASEDGPAAAVQRYRELRERYLGRRAYDFGNRPLLEAAARLADAEGFDAAVALYELTLEFHPPSAEATYALGQAHEGRGDTAAALAAYRRTLELAPDHAGAQRRLAALGGGD